MPLKPLADPAGVANRLNALVKAVPMVSALSSSLLVINGFQTASMAIKPFSRKTFRKINRFAANTWWSWTVESVKAVWGTKVIITGDDVPEKENGIVVVNHQQMPDITYLMFLAKAKGRLGDMKWFVKDPIKYVPGIGWGMVFLDCLFVKRDWNADRASIDNTFSQIINEDIPLWLISFVEGTRVSPKKLEKAQEYAAKNDLQATEHVLLPRTKGFVASVQGLRNHVDAVYDVTIGYKEGVPSLWQYCKGYSRVAHLHVRRYPIAMLPAHSEDLSKWLYDRFVEKDALLEHFYAQGSFPSEADHKSDGVCYNEATGFEEPVEPDTIQ